MEPGHELVTKPGTRDETDGSHCFIEIASPIRTSWHIRGAAPLRTMERQDARYLATRSSKPRTGHERRSDLRKNVKSDNYAIHTHQASLCSKQLCTHVHQSHYSRLLCRKRFDSILISVQVQPGSLITQNSTAWSPPHSAPFQFPPLSCRQPCCRPLSSH
jgi:hypothetical protein